MKWLRERTRSRNRSRDIRSLHSTVCSSISPNGRADLHVALERGARVVALVHDLAGLAQPVGARVAAVPHESEHAARPQHARDLGHRALGLEPVPRLARDDRVDRVVLDGDVLGGAEDARHAGHGDLELLEHLLDGVDGDDVAVERDERLGELAGAGAEVEHAHGVADEPCDRLDRVAGSGLVVHGCRGAERARALRTVAGSEGSTTRPGSSGASGAALASFMP